MMNPMMGGGMGMQGGMQQGPPGMMMGQLQQSPFANLPRPQLEMMLQQALQEIQNMQMAIMQMQGGMQQPQQPQQRQMGGSVG